LRESQFAILLVDDHRSRIRRIIEKENGLRVCGETDFDLNLNGHLKKSCPNLIILDISMPNLRTLETAREIKRRYLRVKVLLITLYPKIDFLRQGLAAGIDGFLLKQDADSELIQAIQTVQKGEKYFSPRLSNLLIDLALEQSRVYMLTAREREVLNLLAEGKTTREIADLLYISNFTARRHRENIMKKLNLKSLAKLIKYAISQERRETL
jgi:DNA-binding NarL/FixJ family response regulator